MQHFPIFLNTRGLKIVIVGDGEAALAKFRLLRKTEAAITIFAPLPDRALAKAAADHCAALVTRWPTAADLRDVGLIYAASENEDRDALTSTLARKLGVQVNVVDNLTASDFITPAIVDRDPVTVAIGTEGAAPVLARAIKRDLEDRLPTNLGILARIGKAARNAVDVLPTGRLRRDFWSAFYFTYGPRAFGQGGAESADAALHELIDTYSSQSRSGHVDLAGAGPGDPELLTLKVRRALDEADVVIHDRLVSPDILELARREALIIPVGKEGFGPSTKQSEINDLMISHAQKGLHVVRLKSGDPTVFGRLDEELEALDGAGVPWSILPGVTAASAAVAALGQSQTKRGRNSSLRVLTGHDIKGFADHDWRALARTGEVAAIYMGKRAARFLQGRLLMHGGNPDTPVSVVENASRPDQRVLATTLGQLEPDLGNAKLTGPAVIILGLAPRAAEAAIANLKEELA